MKIRLGLLMGGSSGEREVSLWSGGEIYRHLNKDKYDIRVIEIPEYKSNKWVGELINDPPDIVLSALHGGMGENGAVQGMLDVLGIPYVGSKVLSSAVCMDKAASKQIMRYNHIPVADDVMMHKNESLEERIEEIQKLGFPLIVKPNRGGSSIGISMVNDITELDTAVRIVRDLDDDILIEQYIHGREITCGLVETENGLNVLTLLDISTDNPFFDYNDKYMGSFDLVAFSTQPVFLQTMIKEIAKKVFICLNCHGYGRVDMIVSEEQVYVLEMNTLPGLTSHSLIPKAASADSTFAQFLDDLISFELKSGDARTKNRFAIGGVHYESER